MLGQDCNIARLDLILVGGVALQPGDLLARIPKGTKDRVLLAVRHRHWLAQDLPGREVGDHILPDPLSSCGDLEEAAEGALGDESIPVGQPLRAGDVRAEEILWGLVHIFPDDLLRLPTALSTY